MRAVTAIVLAKDPVPGRVKTRLVPPCTPEQAARLARAALEDTLAAVSGASLEHRLLALDGDPGRWRGHGYEIVAQQPGGLDRRIAGAFEHCRGPAVLVGMDTPQLTAQMLDAAAAHLLHPSTEAVLGPAADGGYWCIGLREPDDVFADVPMSRDDTFAHQLRALEARGLATTLLPTLRDVDTFDDARIVARQAPTTRFARALANLAAPAPVQ